MPPPNQTLNCSLLHLILLVAMSRPLASLLGAYGEESEESDDESSRSPPPVHPPSPPSSVQQAHRLATEIARDAVAEYVNQTPPASEQSYSGPLGESNPLESSISDLHESPTQPADPDLSQELDLFFNVQFLYNLSFPFSYLRKFLFSSLSFQSPFANPFLLLRPAKFSQEKLIFAR